MVKSSISEDRMSILPQNNTCIPLGESQYTDDHPTTNLPVYSNVQQQYPYTLIDTQQLQQPELQSTGDPQQTITSSTNFLPHLLMLQEQEQQPSTSQHLDNSDIGTYSNDTHENTLISTKIYGDCNTNNNNNNSKTNSSSNNNATIQDSTPTTSLYTMNTNNFWEPHPLQSLTRSNLINNLTISVNNGNTHSERGIAGFVSKLYQSLQAPENGQKYAHWCRHKDKDMFVIDCIPRFTDEVLPRLFKHCKFPSFVRQLNIYGFQRDTDARKSKDTKDKETCRWHHPYFRPGRRDLFHLIRRKATQNSRRKRIQQVVEEDPDTIVNMDSEDDYSDIGGEKFGLQRRPSSVSSISNSVSQRDTSMLSTSSSHLELQSNLQPQQPPQRYQPHHQLLSNAIYQQQDPPPDFDLVDPLMHHQHQKHHHHHHQQQQHDPSSLHLETALPLAMQHNIVKMETQSPTLNHEEPYNDPVQNSGHMNRLLKPDYGGESSAPPTFNDINHEQHLQQQLCQLQNSYKNDRDYYARQMHLAYSRIESQRAHIQQLEAISAQRQYQIQNQPQQQQQKQQTHSGGPFTKRDDATSINNGNIYTTAPYLTKTEPESTSPPNHLPINHPFYSQQHLGYYSGTPPTNGSHLSMNYGVSNTHKPVSTSTSSSNHTNAMESQQQSIL